MLLFILLFISFPIIAQEYSKNDQSFVYMDDISNADLSGKNIIEFIPSLIRTTIKTQKGEIISAEDNEGYLVIHKTPKGKSLGIRGINIVNKSTGELNYYPLGDYKGLKVEKIVGKLMFLKGPTLLGGDREYNMFLTCSISR
ncbi:MAG: hypothetical protein AAGI07_16785 [Bacteroidota bacterium]